VRLGRKTAVVTAVLATALSASSLAGGSPLPESGTEPNVVPKRVRQIFHPPRHAFPMRARPQYGDGLDAGRGHEGQDMFAAAGTPLVAVANAVVIESGSDGGRGNYVSIYDPAAKRTYNYFHMLGPALARRGQRVRAGEKLGELGCTGSCWGNHLHFEARAGRGPYGPVLDPMPILQRLRGAGTR
jgi:murein DD-endopeptidase MepM/ murein hydrolase activator NlpD